MKVISTGNLENFDKALERLVAAKSDFVVKERGASRQVSLDHNMGMKFMAGKMSGAFMCSLVKKDIDNYLLTKPKPLVYNKFYNVQYINANAIEKLGNKPIACYDADYCYFQTAYNLGYITKKTFKRGIADKKLKSGLLAAIGGLNSLDFYKEYKGGVLVKKYPDWDKYNKYSPFYWNVIERVWTMMQDCIALLGDDLYMWLTDCCYINPDREEEVKKFLEAKGYNHKRFMANFESIDFNKNEVVWYDAKANKVKTMSFYGKDTY